MHQPERHQLLGLPLSTPTTAQFIDYVRAAVRARQRPVIITYLNAATFNLAFTDTAYARDLAAFDCVYADGQAVVWGARERGIPVPERVNAGDFTRDIVAALAGDSCRIALIGGRPASPGTQLSSEAERTAERFRAWAPGLQIVYTHHGFISAEQAETMRAELDAANPDLILIGMGAPLQETWTTRWAPQGRPRVWWCVGALFEYYAGTRPRAPQWMRRLGLEWLFRLALEPARLWRRYLIGNPLFIYRLLRGRPPVNL